MEKTGAAIPCIGSVDVAVIGGGPAGAACALALRTYSNHSVALVEAGDYSEIRIGEHVSSSIMALLEYLQIKDTFLKEQPHIGAYNITALWGGNSSTQRQALRNQFGEGFLLERNAFDRMLAETCHARGGRLYLSTRVESVVPERSSEYRWRIRLRHTSGKKFDILAKYIIDATGRKARIARRLGGLSQTYDNLVGASAFYELDAKVQHLHTILIEPAPDGWWYSAPLPGNLLVVTYMTDAAQLQQHGTYEMTHWQSSLLYAPHTRQRTVTGTKGIYADLTIRPAHTQVLSRIVGDGWLAIGDAATSYDPLSAMGVGSAISSACYAARALISRFSDTDCPLLGAYASGMKQQFLRYLPQWRQYYAYEPRWKNRDFWLSRRDMAEKQPAPEMA